MNGGKEFIFIIQVTQVVQLGPLLGNYMTKTLQWYEVHLQHSLIVSNTLKIVGIKKSSLQQYERKFAKEVHNGATAFIP